MREKLSNARGILRESVLYTLTQQERTTLLGHSEQLMGRLVAVSQSSLMVGLLGGTGVGKSTLMNALAGSVIATTSHRRPHTDAVLLYRYVDTPLPDNVPVDRIPWSEFTHTVDSIRHILLCDLPDFDSLVGEHRHYVLEFLESLDLIAWVMSPEKYADGRFYEFLQEVPKAREYFYFILNKTDTLFDGKQADQGFSELDKITASLRRNLKDHGIESPLIYTLSATEAFQGTYRSHWNQFSALRQHIFQQRKYKEIRDIKFANLDSEVRVFLSSFDKEHRHLKILHDVVQGSLRELEKELSQWRRSVSESMNFWMETTPFKAELMTVITDTDAMVGTVSIFAFLGGKAKKPRAEGGGGDSVTITTFLDDISDALEQHYGRLGDSIIGRLLRNEVSPTLLEKVKERIVGKNHREETEMKIRHLSNRYFTSGQFPRYRLFKGVQYITYFLLFILLVFALAGEGAWQTLFDTPGFRSCVNFVVSALYALFSPRGLAALGSYALINVFFGYRFYMRYRRVVKKRAETLLNAFTKDIEMLWDEELENIKNDLDELAEGLKHDIENVKTLRE